MNTQHRHPQMQILDHITRIIMFRLKVKSLSRVRLFATPWTTRLLCPWDFPGNSTGVDCHFLLQRIFPTQGWNPGLSHCRQMLYHLSHWFNRIKLETLCLQPKVSYFNNAVEKMEDACRRISVFSLIHSRNIYRALTVLNFVLGDKDAQINMT